MSSLKKTVSNEKKEIKKKVSKKKSTTKLNNKDKVVEKIDKKKIDFKSYLTKTNITYFVLLLLDIVLVIYMARKNIVNYIVISDVEVFVSKTRYLLWGRNYINLIIILFFYIYTCLVNKFFLKRKNTKKFLIWLFGILVVVNVLLFILFTKKVY